MNNVYVYLQGCDKEGNEVRDRLWSPAVPRKGESLLRRGVEFEVTKVMYSLDDLHEEGGSLSPKILVTIHERE